MKAILDLYCLKVQEVFRWWKTRHAKGMSGIVKCQWRCNLRPIMTCVVYACMRVGSRLAYQAINALQGTPVGDTVTNCFKSLGNLVGTYRGPGGDVTGTGGDLAARQS